ncbi:MAG TPA: type I restriction enzyme HsdR N-terminal domain-containing protein [Bacteroidales bacterium]|nr:type I restriction enzyme HsdR N-terminal domain-containing protein [Bacteroidales bacterium]
MHKDKVFCIIRKRYVALTPEEGVRQNVINYLIMQKNYPQTLISVEGEIKVNNLRKRYDVLVYDAGLMPFMLIECKAPNIKITQETLNQISIYSLSIDASYFLLTNGERTFCLKKDIEKRIFTLEEEIPKYPFPKN